MEPGQTGGRPRPPFVGLPHVLPVQCCCSLSSNVIRPLRDYLYPVR